LEALSELLFPVVQHQSCILAKASVVNGLGETGASNGKSEIDWSSSIDLRQPFTVAQRFCKPLHFYRFTPKADHFFF
jgi:hypothetical protein